MPTLGPAGDRIVVGGVSVVGSNHLRVVDAETLETRGRLAGYHDAFTRLAVSPDGKRLATSAMDGRLLIWDLAAAETGPEVGQALHDVDGRQGELLSVHYTDDGNHLVTVGRDRSVRIRDAATGERVWPLFSPELKNIYSPSAESPHGFEVTFMAVEDSDLDDLERHRESMAIPARPGSTPW